jgi:hypothetical protein
VVTTGVEDSDDVALGHRLERVVLREHVTCLVDVAGNRHDLGPRRIGRAADDDLLRIAIDEIRAVDVPAEIEADEPRPAVLLDGDDLAEKDRRVLRDVVARLAADDDTERSKLAGDDGSVGVEIDWLLGRAGRYAETATDIDLLDPMAGGDEAGRDAGDPGECRFERGQAVVPEPARAGVEMDRVNREAMPGRGSQRIRDPVS